MYRFLSFTRTTRLLVYKYNIFDYIYVIYLVSLKSRVTRGFSTSRLINVKKLSGDHFVEILNNTGRVIVFILCFILSLFFYFYVICEQKLKFKQLILLSFITVYFYFIIKE